MTGTTGKHLFRILPLVFAAAAALSCARPAAAASGPWAEARGVKARILSSTDAVGYAAKLPAGIEVQLEEGWDTYWRTPGDAGAAMKADWSKSRNLTSAAMEWPAPRRDEIFDLQTYGYLHQVIFPLTVVPDHPGDPVALRATLDMLVCKDVCQPVSLDVTLDLPTGPVSADATAANQISRAEARVPGDPVRAGLSVTGLESVPSAAGVHTSLRATIASREPLGPSPDIFIESGKWTFGKPKFTVAENRLSATAELPVTSGPDAVGLMGSPVTVTLTDGERSSETKMPVGGETPGLTDRIGAAWPFLGTAFLGGLLLNLMPCVLPVLSLKLFSVISQQGRGRRKVRVAFLASAAGIVASMLVLAGAMELMKAAGATAGWGLQFQQPGFLIAVAAALLVFATAMSGSFELELPGPLMNAMARAGGDGMAGSFVAGGFATMLATPCSAPFVGTAVAFALARGPLETTAVFSVLGAGLAAPYILVALFPGLIRLLPRPGRWMVTLRRILGAALVLTAAWLLWILEGQSGPKVTLAAVAALAAMLTLISVRNRIGHLSAAVGAVTCVFWALGLTAYFATVPPVGGAALAASRWTRFDQAQISRDVAEGKTVFVDVTATWCVTCQANRAVALGRTDVTAALTGPGVVAMMADWTLPDPAIMGYLASKGRFGIPFNAVYGPGAPHGIVLSEILTPDALLAAIKKAGTKNGG